MREFQDGDKIKSKYGQVWTRRDGAWYAAGGGVVGDAAAAYMLTIGAPVVRLGGKAPSPILKNLYTYIPKGEE